MKSKLHFLVLIQCGLILSALLIRNGRLLLLAIPFLVYLIVGFIQAPEEIKLVADRTIDRTHANALELIKISILIKNQGITLVNLHLNDALYPSMELVEGLPHKALTLTAGETVEINYVFRAERGVYHWKTINACASDPFGLFDLQSELPAPGKVVVLPAPMRIYPKKLKPRFTLHTAGPIAARLAGSGTDFWSIREYRSGDPLRRINWRKTARHRRKNFTNEYEREEIADFGLILDTRQLSNEEEMEAALFEYSVSAIASLSENFLREGNRVSLLILGKSIASVFPGYGKKQSHMILRSLAQVKLGDNMPLRSLEYFPVRLFPARSLIVIFSTVDSDDLATYARLRASGYDVLLISPDPVDYAAQSLPPTNMNILASRAARVERIIRLKRLMKLGIMVIDWQVDKPLEPLINNAARPFVHRRGMQ